MKKNKISEFCLTVLLFITGTIASHGQLIDITSSGTAILGTNTGADLTTTGTPLFHSGSAANLTDGNLATHADTATFSGTNDLDGYVGLVFSTPTTSSVSQLTLNMYLFGAGTSSTTNAGWFGTKNDGTMPLGGNLVAPVLQLTLDGTTWSTVSSTNNYVSTLTGLGTTGATGLITYNLVAPVSGIQGIRLIGPAGGNDPFGHNFIGVAELNVLATGAVPEPSSYVLTILGGLGLFVALIRRRSVRAS